MGLLFRFIIFVFAAGLQYSLPATECCADDGERKEAGLRIAAFQCDITPPVNEPIGLGFIALPKTVARPLLAKGLVLQDTGIFQVYFTGCGGDVAMGKYNDRSREARTVLTNRIYTDRGGYEQTYAFSGPCEQLLLTTMEHLLEGK